MLLKALFLALMAFAGSVGLLKASVATENYILLLAGVSLAIAAVLVALRSPVAAARPA